MGIVIGQEETLLAVVILTAVLVMALSRLLDHIWARSLPGPALYFFISAPGVVIHECAHIIGCLVTGAPIKKVVLLSKDGGMVSYGRPKIPVLGNVIISTAPLFFLPLVLALLTWIFGTYLGCTFFQEIPALNSPGSIITLASAIGQTFSLNLISSFNAWFLLYLYLVTSLVLSFSPSTQDLNNALFGLVALIIAVFLIFIANIPYVTKFFVEIVGYFSMGLAIGFVFELVALPLSLPLLLFYRRA
ncbi:MAG: hypothetical protein WC342_06240 [Methanoregula sp.]|jgi:hypothetical protein